MHCLSVDIPQQVKFGSNVILNHNCYGTVIHPGVIIGNNVSLYHNVTLGRKYPYGPFGGIIIQDGATISAGAKILAGKDTVIIGEGAVVAANAVLTHSIGKNEIWAGIPARKVKDIQPEDMILFRKI